MAPALFLASCLLLLVQRTTAADSASLLVEPVSKDNSAECDCYIASGPDPGYFQYHRYWDFRNIPDDGDNDYTVAPAFVLDSQNQGTEPITSGYLNTSQFVTDWAIQQGPERPDSSVPAINSAQNVYISRNTTNGAQNSTFLTLRSYRLPEWASIAEIDSNQMNLLHSSIRVRARLIPNGLSNSSAPSAASTSVDNSDAGSNASHPIDMGVVFGFFTYHSDTQESDIEILTDDNTTQIHYSNQPDYNYRTGNTVPDASTQLTMQDDLVWTEWLDHRIDWFDGVSRWYVNDQLVLNKTVNAPTQHSGLTINLWSDGGEWSGNMSVGSQVTVGIEWIDMVFNVSGNVNGKGNNKRDLDKRKAQICHIGCNVDAVQVIGTPEVAFNTSSMAFSLIQQGGSGSMVYGAAILVGLFLLLI